MFKVMKRKNLQPRILYLARLIFRFDGEIKSFSDKQQLREFPSGYKLIFQQKFYKPEGNGMIYLK